MFYFEKLRVYQEGLSLADTIYTLTCSFPKEEQFGLTSQLRRSTLSISLNIAEGSSRSKKEFRHFLDIARGSCYESATILLFSHKRNYLSPSQYMKLYNECNKLCCMINKLKASMVESKE